MPHMRQRFEEALLLKRLKHSPLVSIQGARQTGNSFLAKIVSSNHFKSSKFNSLDQLSNQIIVNHTPESFLSENSYHFPLIIDEALKAPALFDAIQYSVDMDRRSGRFLLLIEESLDGEGYAFQIFDQ